MTKDRLVVADVASNPNGVYYSASGNYSLFTVGINSQDPYIDPIGSPGERTTALKYALGRLFVFKQSSLTSCILGDQYTSKCYPVSSSVGTIEPLSIVELPGSIASYLPTGAIEFRGNDGNYWRADSSGISLLSRKISHFVASQTSGYTQNFTVNSGAGWNTGNQTPSGSWNTVSVPNSIFPSTTAFVANSTATFSASNAATNAGTGYNSTSVQFGAVPVGWDVNYYGDSQLTPDTTNFNWTQYWQQSICGQASIANSTLTISNFGTFGGNLCSAGIKTGYFFPVTINPN